MWRRLVLTVRCGECTCYSEPGVPCQFLRTRKFGSISYCALWQDTDHKGRALPLDEVDGWLQRRAECLEAEKGNNVSNGNKEETGA